MSFHIALNHQLRLVEYNHKGLIERIEIGKAWTEILQIEEFINGSYNLLTDYTGGKFNFNIKDLDAIDEFFKSKKDILVNKKQAVVLDDPHSTAISLIFENKLNYDIGFVLKNFTSKSAAYNWLS